MITPKDRKAQLQLQYTQQTTGLVELLSTIIPGDYTLCNY